MTSTTEMHMAADFSKAQYKLFELPDHLLQELLQSPATSAVAIKGFSKDEAVLTTTVKSYTLRLADSSNSHLLVGAPPTAAEADEKPASLSVLACVNEHYELVPTAPRLERIREMLVAEPVGISTDTTRRPTLEQLEHSGQCSRGEVREALKRYRAVEMDGWCTLDPQFERDLCMQLISFVTESSMSFDSVDVLKCVGALEVNWDEVSVRHCLRNLSTSASASASLDEWDAALYASKLTLDVRAISRIYAQCILAEARAWPQADFFEAWQEMLPVGIETERSDLDGIAIFTADGKVRELNVEGLPLVTAARFKVLFGVKPRWTMNELTPYITELLPPGKTAEAFVLLHARALLEDGTRFYIARA